MEKVNVLQKMAMLDFNAEIHAEILEFEDTDIENWSNKECNPPSTPSSSFIQTNLHPVTITEIDLTTDHVDAVFKRKSRVGSLVDDTDALVLQNLIPDLDSVNTTKSVEDAVNTLAEYIIIIMQSLHNYRKIKDNENSCPADVKQAKTNFILTQSHYFSLAYKIMVDVFLPDKKYRKHKSWFINKTLVKANDAKIFPMKCVHGHVEPIFSYLVKWSLETQSFLIHQRNSMIEINNDSQYILPNDDHENNSENTTASPLTSIFSSGYASPEIRSDVNPETLNISGDAQRNDYSPSIFNNLKDTCNSLPSSSYHNQNQYHQSMTNCMSPMLYNNHLQPQNTHVYDQFYFDGNYNFEHPQPHVPVNGHASDNNFSNNNMNMNSDITNLNGTHPEDCCCICGVSAYIHCYQSNRKYCSVRCQKLDQISRTNLSA